MITKSAGRPIHEKTPLDEDIAPSRILAIHRDADLALFRTRVNSRAVNFESRSASSISGVSHLVSASSAASIQNAVPTQHCITTALPHLAFSTVRSTGRAFGHGSISFLPPAEARDVVVLDNLSAHKCRDVRRAIRAVGAKMFFLPAYRPDFNPIEQVFAKLKHRLRKAAERTMKATWSKIGSLIGEFSTQECQNYIRNSAYLSISRKRP